MRTKKAIAVLLAVVILAIPFAVVSYAAPAIVSAPDKTQYTDCEFFNPQGLVVSYNGTEVAYSPIDPDFAFSPALNEYLTVAVNSDGEDVPTNTVEVYYKNQFAGTVTIEVSHVHSGELVSFSEAGHGYYCLGCAKVLDYSEHNIPEFIPNDDGNIFIAQTETGKCLDCGAEVTQSIPGTEGFLSIFGGEMTEFESTIIGYIYMIAVSLIQALAGIR